MDHSELRTIFGAPLMSEIGFCMASCSYICIYISVRMAAPWGSLTLLSFHSLCLHLHNHLTNGKYSRIRVHNTKPAQSLRRTFSKKTTGKRTGSITKWPPQRLLFTRLEIVFVTFSSFTKQTKIVSRRWMLLRRFNKSCLHVAAPNATKAERPFYEHSRMVLHVTRRLLLFDSSYQFNLCGWYYWIAS